mmetsp:Transcript_12916/g.27891  ORF Transcript_12916/g.27891 Transcript_12916/m.27891 type:complete len:232 (-) Transcript_12916:7-702(-)
MFPGGSPLSDDAREANVRSGSGQRSSRIQAVELVRWSVSSCSAPIVDRLSRCFAAAADVEPLESVDGGPPSVASMIWSQYSRSRNPWTMRSGGSAEITSTHRLSPSSDAFAPSSPSNTASETKSTISRSPRGSPQNDSVSAARASSVRDDDAVADGGAAPSVDPVASFRADDDDGTTTGGKENDSTAGGDVPRRRRARLARPFIALFVSDSSFLIPIPPRWKNGLKLDQLA